MNPEAWRIRLARPDELPACLAIRREVFVEGQNVPEDLEFDGLDGEAVHIIALYGAEPAATARLRSIPEGVAKAERVAVRAPFRGRGVGAQVMDALEAEARQRGLSTVVLSAQVPAIGFYEARGYEAYGSEFMDAGIPHRAMRLTLSRR